MIETVARECIANKVRLLNRAVTAIYDETLRPHGLKISQMSVLVGGAKPQNPPLEVPMTATHVLTHFAVSSRDYDGQAGKSPATAMPNSPRSRRALWGGRAMSGFAVLFLLFDASVKVLQLPIAVEATTQLGYSTNVLFWLGLLELACLAVYLVPRTAVLGAVLWTGYLGGAVATHVRVGNPLLSQAFFPVYVALFLWGGLWLRDERLRAVLPLRAPK